MALVITSDNTVKHPVPWTLPYTALLMYPVLTCTQSRLEDRASLELGSPGILNSFQSKQFCTVDLVHKRPSSFSLVTYWLWWAFDQARSENLKKEENPGHLIHGATLQDKTRTNMSFHMQACSTAQQPLNCLSNYMTIIVAYTIVQTTAYVPP